MKLKLFVALVALVAAGCRNADTDSDVLAFAENVGTLYLVPDVDSHLIAGVVQYRIYENGSVRYSGDLTYSLHPGSGLDMQVPFDGQTSVQPATILSASYKQAGFSWVERKVGFNVTSVAGNTAVVSGQVIDPTMVDSPDAAGTFQVDASGKMISIIAADVSGTVFAGTPAAIKLHLKLSNQAPAGSN